MYYNQEAGDLEKNSWKCLSLWSLHSESVNKQLSVVYILVNGKGSVE